MCPQEPGTTTKQGGHKISLASEATHEARSAAEHREARTRPSQRASFAGSMATVPLHVTTVLTEIFQPKVMATLTQPQHTSLLQKPLLIWSGTWTVEPLITLPTT